MIHIQYLCNDLSTWMKSPVSYKEVERDKVEPAKGKKYQFLVNRESVMVFIHGETLDSTYVGEMYWELVGLIFKQLTKQTSLDEINANNEVTLVIEAEISDVYAVFISEYSNGVVKYDHEPDKKRIDITFKSINDCAMWCYEFGYWRYTSKI